MFCKVYVIDFCLQINTSYLSSKRNLLHLNISFCFHNPSQHIYCIFSLIFLVITHALLLISLLTVKYLRRSQFAIVKISQNIWSLILCIFTHTNQFYFIVAGLIQMHIIRKFIILSGKTFFSFIRKKCPSVFT